jgi:hypothetical protein
MKDEHLLLKPAGEATVEDAPIQDVEQRDLGPCCICGDSSPTVRNVGCLNKKAPIPGRGWACVVCDLPPDGAMVVLCDACAQRYEGADPPLKWACRGHPGTDGRIPIEELSGSHEHDMARHDAFDRSLEERVSNGSMLELDDDELAEVLGEVDDRGSLEWSPEPLEALRARFPAALRHIEDLRATLLDPATCRRHVFDYVEDDEAWRLSISLARDDGGDDLVEVMAMHIQGIARPAPLAVACASLIFAQIAGIDASLRTCAVEIPGDGWIRMGFPYPLPRQLPEA